MNPTMISHSKNHFDQVSEIANCLADNFVKPLYNFCTQKSYYVYSGILTEIIDRAQEFHEQYQDKLNDRETFEKSDDNIYDATTPHEFLVTWGNARTDKFFFSQKCLSPGFCE